MAHVGKFGQERASQLRVRLSSDVHAVEMRSAAAFQALHRWVCRIDVWLPFRIYATDSAGG